MKGEVLEGKSSLKSRVFCYQAFKHTKYEGRGFRRGKVVLNQGCSFIRSSSTLSMKGKVSEGKSGLKLRVFLYQGTKGSSTQKCEAAQLVNSPDHL